MMDVLPKSWVLTNLESVAIWGSGGTPSRKNKDYFQGNIPWIKTGELGDKYIRSAEEKISEEAIKKSSAKIFPKGSVGIAMYGATIGKLSIWGFDASTNQACAVAQPYDESLYNEYLYYFLISEKRDLINAGKGGAQPNISQGILKSWNIRLAPLNEQKRIVAKIEELFSELDKGIESLKTAREQLKVYRQAVLKHAFEGKLTADWREQNKDKLETADELLDRIKKEGEAAYQQHLEEWKVAVKSWEQNGEKGKKPPKPRKTKELLPLSVEETESYVALPKSWKYCRLGQLVFTDVGFAFKSKEFAADGIALLRGDNIEPGSLRWKDTKYWPLEKVNEYRHLIVSENEIIIAMDRPVISSGLKVAITKKEDTPCLLVQRVCRLVNNDNVSTNYLFHTINNNNFIKHCLGNQTGTQLPHISETQIRSHLVPLCSIAEQNLIAKVIEEKFSVIDDLESSIEIEILKAEVLRQSILKQAFSGRLLAQDPNDEPASVLLERIKAEKKQVKKTKKDKAA